MDPIIENLMLGVIANGLTSLLIHLGNQGHKVLVGEELLQEIQKRGTALLPILNKATEIVSEELDWENPNVHLFLSSPDVEAFVRQLFATKLSTEKKGYLTNIRQEFHASLALYMGWPGERYTKSANLLFDALFDGCENALNVAVDMGILSAKDAKDAFRHQIIRDELAVIQKNVDFLTAKHRPKLEEILEYEKKYRQQVDNRHKYITPPDFDKVRKLLVNDLYVSPDFVSRIKNQEEEEPREYDITGFRNVIYRTALLGDPGSGKSTFCSKLAHDLATNYTDRPLAGRQVTPILVILRDYGAMKNEKHCSILQFIEVTAESVYQLPSPPVGAFEYMLLNGHAIVIFDGLDELLDTSYRQTISADVESFCTLFPSVPVLVTSRKVGYEQAPLDPYQFDVFHLAPFDRKKAETYVNKWFSLDSSLSAQQQEKHAKTFMTESQFAPDLRSNALLLALMCNIYRGEGYIPKNRPDVYEKCATMLFERWDKGRGIHYVLPFEAHIRPAMMYLAHWIYTDEKRQSGVVESDLTTATTDYLYELRFEDRDEAEYAARAFVKFCQGRAWVFSDTGTTKVGERLYQFTHRTFLEYFTAAYLVRTHRTPESLLDYLLPRIIDREWDVVAQLAFQLQHKQLEGAGDELLTLLINQSTDQTHYQNILSFAARCLEFLVPSPRVTATITDICVRHFIESQSNYLKEPVALEPLDHGNILTHLYNVATENRDVVANNLVKILEKYFSDDDTFKAYLAFDIGLNFNINDYWETISTQVYKEHLNQLKSFLPHSLILCMPAWKNGDISIANIVAWHGFEIIFTQTAHLFSTTSGFTPPADWLLSLASFWTRENPTFFENRERNLTEIGHILLDTPHPWTRTDKANLFSGLRIFEASKKADNEDFLSGLEPDAVFGYLVLLMILMEYLEKRENRINQVSPLIRKQETSIFKLLVEIILARYTEIDEDKVSTELTRCGFSDIQQEFVKQWLYCKITLVEYVEEDSATENLVSSKN